MVWLRDRGNVQLFIDSEDFSIFAHLKSLRLYNDIPSTRALLAKSVLAM